MKDEFHELTSKICKIYKVVGYKPQKHILSLEKKVELVAPIDKADQTLEQKKERLKASIDAKKKLNLKSILAFKREPVPVSEP